MAVSLFPPKAIFWQYNHSECTCLRHYAPDYEQVAVHNAIPQSHINMVNNQTLSLVGTLTLQQGILKGELGLFFDPCVNPISGGGHIDHHIWR